MELQPPVLVAVYGTLRKNHYNNYLLRNQAYVGLHRTTPEYTMYSLGGFPAVTLNGENEIVLEIFQVNDNETLKNLDSLEGYPTFYNRKEIDTEYGKAWMYYMENDARDFSRLAKIASGDWNEFTKINEEVLEND